MVVTIAKHSDGLAVIADHNLLDESARRPYTFLVGWHATVASNNGRGLGGCNLCCAKGLAEATLQTT